MSSHKARCKHNRPWYGFCIACHEDQVRQETAGVHGNAKVELLRRLMEQAMDEARQQIRNRIYDR